MRRAPSPAAVIAACEAAGLNRRAIAAAAQLSPGYITKLAQGDRGQRIGNAAMEGLQRALDGARSAHPVRGLCSAAKTPRDPMANLQRD